MKKSIQGIHTKVLDLYSLPSMSFSEPVSFHFSRCRTQEVDSWRSLYGEVVKHLCQKDVDKIQAVLPDSEIGDLKKSKKMKVPYWVRRGIYVETALGVDVILRRIKGLLKACGMDFSDLSIVYYIDEERRQSYTERLERERSEPKTFRLRWDYVGSYKGSQPVSFRYGTHRTKTVRSWSELYVQVISYLAEEFPRVIRDGVSFGDTRVDIARAGKKKNTMRHSVNIGQDLVVEVFGTSTQLIDRMYEALTLCKVDPATLVINFTFCDPNRAFEYVGKNYRVKKGLALADSPDSQLIRRLRFLLNKYFEQGYRVESAIDRKRLCTYYEDQYKEAFSVGEEELSALLLAMAKPVSGKIMIKTQTSLESLMKTIVQKISETFSDGATCIYLSELMKLYQRELAEIGIHEEKSFEELLFGFAGNTYRSQYGRICFGRRKPDVRKEIRAYLKEIGRPQSLDSLSLRLWYIPSAVVEREIAHTDEIVLTAAKTYFLAPSLPINKASRNQICDSIRSFFALRSVMTEIELLDIVLQICPYLLEEVSFLTWRGLRESLGYLFREVIEIQDEQIITRAVH